MVPKHKRPVTDKAIRLVSKVRRRLAGLRWRAWIVAYGGSVGRRLEVEPSARLRWPPHRGICIGDNVYVGIGAVVDAPVGSSLFIDEGVKIMHYSVIASSQNISIGRDTQVAEHSSIRDTDHGMAAQWRMKDQEVSAPVQIGKDVWVGRGVAVLRGSTIGDGAVIGANSVVRGEIPPMSIAVGAPARVVRTRQ